VTGAPGARATGGSADAGTPRRDGPVVTFDGPAGSGKSSTARAVARELGFRHLDSGALYRALTWALLDRGVPPDRWPELDGEDFRRLGVRLEPTDTGYRVRVGGRRVDEALRSRRVTEHVSDLARLPVAREALLGLQRQAGAYGRLVADGRDMGTVVFPDADLKVFLVADLSERARRRLREEEDQAADTAEAVEREAERLARRDRRDSERSHAPLRKPRDAWVLDTTSLDFREQVEAVVRRVRQLTGP
jgi:cytidylate kinase